ncbi:uncharacterized protein LOC121417719 [Lytechinus variegatus]|uniref:uncharacterized protein LOC121417719 n=1 Tax=Lytechinus variegatus TaxID=7654 RepID=UPI001BB20975|nr:uncharacterized protein LOC121417719 [Lytechinus variegatus]
MTRIKVSLVVIALLIVFIDIVSSTHFRGGSMTWRAVEVNNEMKAEIEYKLAYQIDTIEGDNDCTREKTLSQAEVEGDDKLIKALSADGGDRLDFVNEIRTSYFCLERHEAADYPNDKMNSWIIGGSTQILNLVSDVKRFIIRINSNGQECDISSLSFDLMT